MYTYHMHSQFTDGAKISKPKNLTSSSNATKSSSTLSVTNNKNEEIIHRDNNMKKAGLGTNNVVRELVTERGEESKEGCLEMPAYQ